MTDFLIETDTDIQTTKRKWSTYRTTRENYQRLYEKKRRGEKINFRERGDHCFSSSIHAPTGEEIKSLCGEGYYVIEHLFDGTAGDWSFAAIIPSQDVVLPEQSAAAQAAPSSQPSTVAQSEPSSARSINDTTETIRATKELLKEVAPQPQQAAPSKDDIAQMIRQAVTDALAQKESTARSAQQPDEMDRLLKTVNGLKSLGVIPERQTNPAPTSAPDPTESFLKTYEKFLDISARINPNGEAHSSWLDKLTGVVESVARVAASPTVHTIVARVLMPPATAGGQAMPNPAPVTAPHLVQPQAEAPAQETEEEETAESAANEVLSDACTDLLNNEDVSQSAKDITRLLEDWPELVPRFEPLFALSSPDLQQALALLAGEAGAQIMTAPHAVQWLDKLKTAIALRRGPVLVANGNGSKAA